MSTTAARRAREVMANSRKVVAIELMTAATALRHRLDDGPEITLGRGTAAALQVVEASLAGAGDLPSDAIAALESVIHADELHEAVRGVCGPLAPVLPPEVVR